ncbi:hypothetical protein Syun_021761 [Stephania yunnanensis]|uniref:Uncharacterized protein n=1 Tax=Stephania yunnanensis TaxID=152371 RepID=A0AAP0IG76_9MAGN
MAETQYVTRLLSVGVAESRQRQADSIIGCGIAIPKMWRMRDINGASDKAHLIPTKYCDSRSWPRWRAGNHSNQRHEYDSLGPRTLIRCLIVYVTDEAFSLTDRNMLLIESDMLTFLERTTLGARSCGALLSARSREYPVRLRQAVLEAICTVKTCHAHVRLTEIRYPVQLKQVVLE